jgi:hypothetical protein
LQEARETSFEGINLYKKLTMKCDKCKHHKFHPAGSWYAVAECGDDPYNYEYCEKGHWIGDTSEPVSEETIGMEDQFLNCKDFLEEDKL